MIVKKLQISKFINPGYNKKIIIFLLLFALAFSISINVVSATTGDNIYANDSGNINSTIINSTPTQTNESSYRTTSSNAITTENAVPGKDLTVTKVSTPKTVLIGQNIQITSTIKNQGDTDITNNFSVRYYLSTDKIFQSANDYALGGITISSLNAGGTTTKYPSLKIPNTIPPGNYYLLAYVDRLNNVTESNETNNILASINRTNIAVPGKDLTVTKVSAPKTVLIGQNIQITSTIKNQGDTDITNNFSVRYYLSTDKIFQSANDYALGGITISGLNAGGTTTKYPSLKIPNTIPPGNYYLLAYVDRLNNVTESNETNNILASINQTNTEGASGEEYKDLIVTSICGPTTGLIGQNIQITSTIKNKGDTDITNDFVVRYYFSTDQTFQSGADYLLGDVTINGLSAGTSITESLSYLVSVPIGQYYIYYSLAFVDALNNVTEANETNNILASINQTNIAVPGEELTVTSVSGPTSGIKDQNITISSTIKNQGDTDINNDFIVRYYLSTDQTFQSGTDYFLGDLTINGLSAGASITKSLSYLITTPIGKYYILAYADSWNNITESNETNNILASINQTNIKYKDLNVTSISNPTMGVKGSPITISSTIKNQGDTDITNDFVVRYYFSTDQTFQSGTDYFLGDVTVNGLSAGASITESLSYLVSVPIGQYYILAYVDRWNNVIESNETNNILASINQTSIAVPGEDLKITSISNPTMGVKGSPITISSTIKNQGDTDITNNFSVRYYISTDQTFQSGTDYFLGDVTVNGLSAGASITESLSYLITTPIGKYYILAYADSWNNITESNETNNLKVAGPISISRSIILEDFTDISNWIASNGASISSDIIGNDNGIKVTSELGNYPTISKNVFYKFNGIAPNIEIWFYLYNEPSNLNNIRIALFGNNGKYIYTYIPRNQIHEGLNSFILPQRPWIINGTTWNDTISKIQLRISNKNNGSAIITFLSLEYKVSGTPQIVLTFDDGSETVYTNAYPIMKQYGIKGTVYVIPDKVGQASYMTLEQLHELHDAGWTIANHSFDHTDLVTLNKEDITLEIQKTIDWLTANGFEDGAYYFACPYGSYNNEVLEVCRELGILTERTIMDGTITNPVADFLQLPTKEIYTETTLNEAKLFIDDAIETKTTSFVLLHHVVEGTPDYGDWNINDFNDLMAYISQTGIETLTNDEWYNKVINSS